MRKCFITGKTSLPEKAAKEGAKKWLKRAYLCEYCNEWHLTHLKKHRTL